MRIASLVAAMAMVVVGPVGSANGQIIGGGGVGISGMLNFSSKSHNASFRAGMVVSAVAPKSGRTLGYVANGEAIATPHVDLVVTLILDNVEVRDDNGRYVQVEVYPDVYQDGNISILKEMGPEITGNALAAKAKQNRLFRTAFRAGDLIVGGYTATLRIRAAKHSSGRLVLFGWGKRDGEIIESSFHFAVREVPQPTSDWEMASQLAGFNILIAPPSPTETPQANPLVQNLQDEIERMGDEIKKLREAMASRPEPKAEEPKMQEWSVATIVKATVFDVVSRKDTGAPYPCDMRWVLRVADVLPTRDLRPDFGPTEKATSDYSDGQTVGAKSVVVVNVRATGDLFIVAWMRGTGMDGKPSWSNAVWVKVDPSVTSTELKFPMSIPVKGGKKP